MEVGGLWDANHYPLITITLLPGTQTITTNQVRGDGTYMDGNGGYLFTRTLGSIATYNLFLNCGFEN